jgi:hypothetical protein
MAGAGVGGPALDTFQSWSLPPIDPARLVAVDSRPPPGPLADAGALLTHAGAILGVKLADTAIYR